MRTWQIRESIPDEIDESLNAYSPIVRKILYYRGIEEGKDAERFFRPNYERDIHDPFLALGMDKAVDRILSAIEKNETIAIFGDYDADGIPGSAILHATLEKIGYKNFTVYIPDRYEEDYGLARHGIDNLHKRGADLIITVDCGITDVGPVEYAKELGMDVIITDHHLPHDELPDAYAIINNKIKEDEYPYKYLCGAGTAWKLACALLEKGDFDVPPGWEKWLLDLAAISTVCDMVPLTGENRAIVHFGLKVLRKTPRVGLQKLFKKARINQSYAREDDIAFYLGPRINIASRMSNASDAYRLLASHDEVFASGVVDHLEDRNSERKETVQVILDEVDRRAEKDGLAPIIVEGEPTWRIGVLGLTCTRIVEKHERPVLLFAENHNGDIKGSMRSDGSVNVLELFLEAGGDDLFDDFGGHKESGGFSLKKDQLPVFKEKIEKAYLKLRKDASEENALKIDAILTLEEVTDSFYRELDKLAPFGVGNERPLFLFENLLIYEAREFGKNGNTHIELTFQRENGSPVKAIAFFKSLADFSNSVLDKGKKVSVVASVEKSFFAGKNELRLKIVDLKLL